MRRSLLWILILLTTNNQVFTQSFDEKNFIHYTRLEGLSNNYITGIVQDSTGYIWVSTYKGLNRFDGKFFTNYFKNTDRSPLTNNIIHSIRLQNKNEIIASTRAGVFSFNTSTRQYKHFIVPVDSIVFYWANYAWDALKCRQNNYVVSTKTGLFVFNNDGKIICRYDQHKASDAGRVELWFGGWINELSNGTVFQENGLMGSVYVPFQNKIDSFFTKKRKNLKQALTDKDGELRISFPGRNDELFIVNAEMNSIGAYNVLTDVYNPSSILPGVIGDVNWDSHLFYINDSLLAITGKVGGFYLLRYDKTSQNISCDEKKYFSSKYCTSIFKDREGRLWIGTNDGLYKLNLVNSFFAAEDLSMQLPEILNASVQSIYVEKNKIFVGLGNEGGLLLLDKNTKKITRKISFKSVGKGYSSINFIFSFSADTLWMGTANGIIWFNKKNYTSGKLRKPGEPEWMMEAKSTNFLSDSLHETEPGEPDWLHQNKARAFFKDSRGNIWLSFGKVNSVVFFDKARGIFKDISAPINPLLKITFCFTMAEDKQGNVWLGGDGLCRWNAKRQIIDSLIPYPHASKTIQNFMQVLDKDDNNNLWLAAYDNEIIQFNCTDNRMYLRLPDNNMIDGHPTTNSPIIHNTIWLGLSNGISAFNIKDYSLKEFNYGDGLPSAAVTTKYNGSFYDSAGNRFYFGAGHYLVSFTPEVNFSQPVATGSQTPQFFLEAVGNGDSVINQLSNNIRLPYSQNNVQLRFNAINFTDPAENRFSYRVMNSKDSSWHELYTQNNLALTKLEPGEHVIEVKLFSLNNRWPVQVKTISVTVYPPFWKTAWFIILIVSIILGLIFFLYRYRIKQINQKANLDRQLTEYEMKALHAQMNPHFIFNCLNSIREMILNKENMQASHYLSKFAQLIRITLTNSSKHFISLQDTIDYLKRYLEMEKIRTDNFNYCLEVDEDLDPEEIFLPPMLIQPFIENAIWHGQQPDKIMQLFISLFKKNNELICIVEDDGVGIETSLKNKNESDHHSVGIANIRQRIQLLNEKYNLKSTVEIEDKSLVIPKNGPGTKVTLHLPVKNVEL